MARPRKPVSAKKTTSRERLPGLFGGTFLRNLKSPLPGATDRDIFTKTLNSVPPEKVREALASASPRERTLFFNTVPADQIRSLIDHVPSVVIGPAKQPPPPPPPAPAGGPSADILMTNYANVPCQLVENDPQGWNKALTDGQTIHDWSPFGPNWFEWSPVYDRTNTFEREGGFENPAVGVTGWVVPAMNQDGLSGEDVWFTHPWWYDWEYYIAPDPQYEGLLAPNHANAGIDTTKSPGSQGYVTDQDFYTATSTARDEMKLPARLGVLGVEIDQGLIPPAFRETLKQGTRIATFGRWIVDSGHSDFHTEIHPPLLMATANVVPPQQGIRGASRMTHVEIISRPYFPSQVFPEGNFIDHLVTEVAKVETPILGFPGSWRVEAHPHVYDLPYTGRPFIELFIRPPVPRSKDVAITETLMVNFHFTVRHGVAVAVYDAGHDTVGIVIVLGDMETPELPKPSNYSVSWSKLGNEYAWIVNIWGTLEEPIDPLGLVVLNRGILTDRYAAPVAQSVADTHNIAGPMPLSRVTAGMGWQYGNDQPFPIYGWMDVYWIEEPIVAAPGSLAVT